MYNNIEKEILSLENSINKYDKKLKRNQIIYKIIAYMHIGSSGSIAVNAFKGLAMADLTGIFVFLGLIASISFWYFVFSQIQEHITNKKEEKEENLHNLKEIQKQLSRNEKYKKSKILNQTISQTTYNKHIKLMLKK